MTWSSDPLRDQDMAPQRVVGDGRDLPGHPEGPVGRGAHAAHHPAVHPGADGRRGGRRPAGRRRRQAVPREPAPVQPHRAALDQRVRGRAHPHLRVRRQGAAPARHGRRRARRAGGALTLQLGAGEGHREFVQLVSQTWIMLNLYILYIDTTLYTY